MSNIYKQYLNYLKMVESKKTDNNLVIEEAKEILEEENLKNESKKEINKEANKIAKENKETEKEKDLIKRLQMLQAEFENFRKRTDKEKHEIILNANASLITELLKVLDNFELSLKHNKDKGVKLIYDELNFILEKQGLKTIETNGVFDPKFHEAIMQIEGEKHGEILEEFQKGYVLNNKLLRASKVKISKSR